MKRNRQSVWIARVVLLFFCIAVLWIMIEQNNAPHRTKTNFTANAASTAAVPSTPAEPPETPTASEDSSSISTAPSTQSKSSSKTRTSSASKSSKASSSAASKTSGLKKYVPVCTYEELAQSLAPYTVETRLQMLKSYFPDGRYWNHAGYDISGLSQSEYCLITTAKKCVHHSAYATSCNHYQGLSKSFFRYRDDCQCLAFASLVSDLLYGKSTPITEHRSFDQIKVGDQVRFVKAAHSVIVIGKQANSVTVLECNYKNNCRIDWGRKISASYFERCGKFRVLSRTSSVASEP